MIELWKRLFPSPKWHIKRDYRRVFIDDSLDKHVAVQVPENFKGMEDIVITSVRGTIIPFEVVKTESPIDGGTKEYFYIDFKSHPLKTLICYFNKRN